MNITQIVSEVGINRNTVGRYLENLLVSGQVEMRRFGMEKIYSLSHRVPLSAILSISSEFVVQLDSSLRIIFANEPFLTLVGTNAENLIGKNIEYSPVPLIFDESFTGFIGNIGEGIAGKEWSGEISLSTKDIILFCRIAPTVFDDGRKGVSVILEDITQKRQAEKRIEESERQFRLLAENSLDMIGRIKPDSTHIYVSPAYETTLGYLPEEVLGKRAHLFIHPEDFPILESIENVLTPENSSATIRFRVKHRDGHYIWIESTVRAIFDEKTRELSEYYTVTRDITERKKADDALRESEDRYRKLIEISPDAVLLHTGGKIIYANPAAFRILGASDSGEIIGKEVIEFIHPAFREAVRTNIESDLEGRITPPIELQMLRIDGTPVLVEGRGTGTIIDGKPAVQVALRDITEQKQAEEALRKSETMYRTLAEASSDLIFVIGSDDKVEYVNSYASALVNKPAYQIIGHPRSSLFPIKVATNQKKALQKVFETGIPVRNEGALTFAGRMHWFDHYLTPLKDTDNHVRSVLGISRDITERKSIEEALHESEEKYRTLIERANDAICVIQDQKIKMCNQRLADFWGGSSEQILGMSIQDFIHPDAFPEVFDRFDRRIAGENPTPIYETILKRKDGSRFYAEVNAGIVAYEGRPADLVIIRDINERKKVQDTLRESEATARALINAPTDSVILLDTRGIILALNETAALRFGRRVDEVIGVLADDLLHEDIARTRRSLITQVIGKGEVVRFEDEREGRTYDTVAYPIVGEEGKVTKIAIVARDITERKNAEKQLRESKQSYQRLLEQSFDAIAIHKDKKIAFLNEKAAKILGAARPQDLIGRPIFDLIHPSSRNNLEDRLSKLSAAPGMPVPVMTEKFFRVDGTTVTVEVMAISFDDNGIPAVRVAFREIVTQ